MKNTDSRPTGLGAGIFLVSLAILLVELLLTRVFSAVMFHHFSFLSVSLAMCGIGMGGLTVNLLPRTFRSDNINALAPYLAIGFALTLVAAAWIAFNSPIELTSNAETWRSVALILTTSLVPLTLGGVIIAHILGYNSAQANRLYFFDLLGAGGACLAMAPLVSGLGAPNAILVSASIAALGGTALSGRRSARIATVAVAAALLLATAMNRDSQLFDVRYTKGQEVGQTYATRWNSFSRVDVVGLAEWARPVGWGYSSKLQATTRELHLYYDADAMTQIPSFRGDLGEVAYLLWDVTSAAHHVRTNDSTLAIGSGGGRDVLAALASGSRRVTGVEINDITVGLLRGMFRDFNGGLYDGYPGVDIVIEDGRSYIRRAPAPFDLIQASLVDTWAASAAGAYALAENSLYTVDAFNDYFDALNPDGIVSFSRWYHETPNEVLRVVALARKALLELGVESPAKHVAIVRTDSSHTERPSLATILVKKSPFTSEEVDRLVRWSDEMLFALPHLPPVTGAAQRGSVFAQLLGSEADAERVIANASADLSPTTDDRPFFFDRVPIAGWMRHRLGLSAPSYASADLPIGSVTLLAALCVTGAAAMVMFLLPLALGGRATPSPSGTLSIADQLEWASYFACLGVGYITVEIVLIQRFNLYLGNPTYALAVVLFTMLVASALGALLAQRFARLADLKAMLAVICATIAVVALGLDAFTDATLSGTLAWRIAATVLFVAPVGLVMGMPFPTGLRHAGERSESLVSWAWAVNGGMSVLGSVFAVIVSMTSGFFACLVFALGIYAVAGLISANLARRSEGERQPA